VIDLDEDRVLEQGTDYTVGYSFNGDRDERGDKITCDPYSSTCESLFVNLGEGKMKGTKEHEENVQESGGGKGGF